MEISENHRAFFQYMATSMCPRPVKLNAVAIERNDTDTETLVFDFSSPRSAKIYETELNRFLNNSQRLLGTAGQLEPYVKMPKVFKFPVLEVA